MLLAPGTRFGQFEIQALIGAGGMGEVYRARDRNLRREVAIKVLPHAFADDPDRLARFHREARILASLNHPHIGVIYGVELAEGLPALVLELIEGDTLAEVLAHGPLPVPRTLAIARQIAAALEAAHERGIVHRDLKPHNIKITPAGVVKVLDFGLAKAVAGEPAGDLTHTSSHLQTETGTIVGTAAYMSPEQARGQAVDRRADIWAFGCVLFEMLAGRRVFARATLSDTIAAVLEREPDWQALPASTPAPVRRLLRRCLAKPLADRLRDMGDATLDLVDNESGADPVASPASRRLSPWPLVLSLIAAAGAGALAAFVWSSRAREPAAAPLTAITRLTSDAGLTTEPSISADGNLVAYASNRAAPNLDIYVQQTSGGAAIRLTDDPADDRQPTVSPDGSLVAFHSDRNPPGVYVVPAFGGNARLVAPEGRAPRFSPDGSRIAYWTGPWLAPRNRNVLRQVFTIPAAGGTPAQVAADVSSAGDAVWAPDGRSLLVFGRDPAGEPDWWWVPLEGEPTRTGVFAALATRGLEVSDPDAFPLPGAWTDQGVLFSASERSSEARELWRISLDPRSGSMREIPRRLTYGTTVDQWPSSSRSGRVAFAAQTVTELVFGLPLDVSTGRVTGPMRRLRDDTAETGRASVSRDGRLMVFPKYEFASGGVWVRELATGRERQLAVTPRTPLNPVMSQDGEWVGYTITRLATGGGGGPGDGYVVRIAGGAPQQVCADCQLDQWTPDGRFAVIANAQRRRLERFEVSSGRRTGLLEADRAMDRVLFGPNGRWMTFNVPGAVIRAPLYADRATSSEEWETLLQVTGAGRTAGLSPDGRLLYLLLERDGFRCLYAMQLDTATGRPEGEPFLVAHFHDAARAWGSTGLGSAAVEGLFVADLYETTSNIWLAALETTGR